MRWLALLLLVAACNEVYGLDRTKPRDASPLVIDDMDGDGTGDAQDNCPQLANPDQADADADGHGDLCDDCPLIGNAQGIDADLDRIGDLCDPHPSTAGDCLLELDTFRDPTIFTQHWKASTGMVIPEPGRLRLRPNLSASAIEVTSLTATDATDIIMLGTAPVPTNTADPNPTVTAYTRQETSARFYGCRLLAPRGLSAEGPDTSIPVTKPLVPKTPANDRFAIRLITTHQKATDTVDVTCRVDHGVSVGTDAKSNLPSLAGPAGFGAAGGESILDAIAMSRFQPGVACPPTSYR